MERPNDDDDDYGRKYKETTQNSNLTLRDNGLTGSTSALTPDKSDVTRTNLDTTRANLDATRNSSTVRRDNLDVNRTNLDTTQANPDITRNKIDASRDNSDVNRNKTDVRSDNFDANRNGSVVSRNNPDVTRNNFDVTRNNTNVTRNNFDVTRDSSVVSRSDSDVTRNSPGMPAYNLPDWFKWFVLAASSIINVIVTGIAFSFGVLYVKLLDEFQQGKARTAAVGSISLGLLFGAGPIAGLIANRIHSRPVAIFGSIIAAVGLLTSSYAESLEVLYVLYSILAGIGFGCLNLTSILCVTEHFDEKQGLACAITSSGCGVGNIIFPIIISHLISSVGWRQTMKILSGIQFLTMFCSFAMVTRTTTLPACCFPAAANTTTTTTNTNTTTTRRRKEPTTSKSSALNNFPNISAILNTYWTVAAINKTAILYQKPKVESVINYIQFPSPQKHFSDSSLSVLSNLAAIDDNKQNNVITTATTTTTTTTAATETTTAATAETEDINSKEDKIENKRRNSGRNFEKNTSKSCNKTSCKSMIRRLLSDFMIFKNARYTIFFSSCLLSATGAGVPAIIISDYAESFGASTQDAAILVSVLGITGFIGRMLAGAASCFYKCNLFLLYFFTMLLAGVATFLIPVLELYWFCMLFAALFGLFYGVTAGLDPCLVACIAGQDNMAVSYGFFTLALGVGSLISATLAGLLRDLTGHYRSSFYLAGVFLCASSLFVLPLAIKSRLRRRHLKVPTCSCVILTRYHVFNDSVCS